MRLQGRIAPAPTSVPGLLPPRAPGTEVKRTRRPTRPRSSPPARVRPSPSTPPRSCPPDFPLSTFPPRARWHGLPTALSPAPAIFLGPTPGTGHGPQATGHPAPSTLVPPSSLRRGAPHPSGCPRPAHLPGLHAWAWPPAKDWHAARAPGVSRDPPRPGPPCRLGAGGVAQRPGGDAISASRREALGAERGSARGAGQFPSRGPGRTEKEVDLGGQQPRVQPGPPAGTPSLRPPRAGPRRKSRES